MGTHGGAVLIAAGDQPEGMVRVAVEDCEGMRAARPTGLADFGICLAPDVGMRLLEPLKGARLARCPGVQGPRSGARGALQEEGHGRRPAAHARGPALVSAQRDPGERCRLSPDAPVSNTARWTTRTGANGRPWSISTASPTATASPRFLTVVCARPPAPCVVDR